MTQVILHMLNPALMINMYTSGMDNQLDQARKMLAEGGYSAVVIDCIGHGKTNAVEIIADEMFDLTNNPARQDEREESYGRGRSLSVGDIVEAYGKKLLCCSFGWKPI